jgi:hypothetical protein
MSNQLDQGGRLVKGASYTSNANRSWPLLICLLGAACGDSSVSELDTDAPDTGAVRVTGAEPTTLPLDSTFNLRVFGSGFGTDSKVVLKVNGAPTSKVRTNATLFVSPQELDASITTAADAPGGPYDIEVEGRNGKQGVGTELVDLKAHVFGISPTSTQPGESVTISGINFGRNREQMVVTFDGMGGFVQSVSNTSILAVVPPTLSPRVAMVEVRIAGTPVPPAVNLEVVRPRIFITGIIPSSAARGEEVTITGFGFGRDRDQVHVSVASPGDALRPGLVLSVDDTTLVAVIPFDAAIGTVLVWVSADRIPVPEPAQTSLTVISRRPLIGTWILTGDVQCCSFGFGPIPGQLGGFLSVSEGSGGGLSGYADVTASHILGGGRLATGPVVGTVYGDGSVTFTVDSRCAFAGHLVTSKVMTGTLNGCADAEGIWQATRQ